jgi:hypothetical protein
MVYFKEYKVKADYIFQNLYHQIFTMERTIDDKVTFTMEKLSPENANFKTVLFQEKIRGMEL